MSTTHALLYGRPGVGKTIVVQRTFELLKEQGIAVHGFYKKEIWEKEIRVCFEVVSVSDGDRFPLAHLEQPRPKQFGDYVGNYRVDLRSFEESNLATLGGHSLNDRAVTIIDEIGQMELKSAKFSDKVRMIFQSPNSVVLATVPGNTAAVESLPLVRQLLTRSDVKLFEVTSTNRDDLPNELADFLKTALSSK